MKDLPVVQKTNTRSYSTMAAVAVIATFPMFAQAAEGGLDMSDGVTQLALAVAAVGALGAAKLAPAALTWVWSLVTGMAKRG